MTFKAAVVQTPPVLLNRDKTIAKAIASIDEAARAGASLIVFPETFVPGYPAWIWRLKPGGDMRLTADIHARLRDNAVDLAKGGLQLVQDAAAEHKMTVVLGINERDSAFSGTTLFNTVVVIGADGTLLNRHRKLMPTNPERMVWGMGDGAGLRVVDTPVGRLGSLICWENYMPLARYALYAQDIEIYVAPTWDAGESWIASMRHIAKEAGCWVIGVSTAIQTEDIPEDFPDRDKLFEPGEWINDGDAVVVKPMGAIAAGPLHRQKGILYADIDVEAARRARRSLDVCGHYSRPDVFEFSVNRKPLRPVTFSD
jgi:nitrilase